MPTAGEREAADGDFISPSSVPFPPVVPPYTVFRAPSPGLCFPLSSVGLGKMGFRAEKACGSWDLGSRGEGLPAGPGPTNVIGGKAGTWDGLSCPIKDPATPRSFKGVGLSDSCF